MKMTIANRHVKASPTFEARKEKDDLKKTFNSFKRSMKESMSVTTSEPIRILGKQRVEEKPRPSMRDAGKKRPTLKELQEKKYPFLNLDLSGLLDDLLEKGIIKSTIGIIRSSTTPWKSALHSRSVLCSWLRMEQSS